MRLVLVYIYIYIYIHEMYSFIVHTNSIAFRYERKFVTKEKKRESNVQTEQ